jgi:hypothetical protein
MGTPPTGGRCSSGCCWLGDNMPSLWFMSDSASSSGCQMIQIMSVINFSIIIIIIIIEI